MHKRVLSVIHVRFVKVLLQGLVFLLISHSAIAKTDSLTLMYLQSIVPKKMNIDNADSFYVILRKISVDDYNVAKSIVLDIASNYRAANRNEIAGICNLVHGKYLMHEDSLAIANVYLLNAIKQLKLIKPSEFLQDAFYEKGVLGVRENSRDSAMHFFNLYADFNMVSISDSYRVRKYLASSIELRRGGIYDGALDFAQKALSKARKNKLNSTLSTAYIQIAEIFDFTNFDTLAYQYKLKSYEFAAQASSFIEYHSNIIKIYPEFAKRKEYKILNEISTYYDSIHSSELYNNKVVQQAYNRFVFLKNYYSQNYQIALDALLSNMNKRKFAPNTIFCYYLKEVGDCYKELGQFRSSIIFYDSCIRIADKKNYIQVLFEVLPSYYKVADTLNDNLLSLRLKDKYISVLNQVNGNRNIAKLSVMQSMIDGINKEQMITLLQRDNNQKKIALKQGSWFRWVLSFAMLLVGIIAFYLWRSRQKIKAANELLQLQKNEMQKQSDSLLSQATAIGRLKAQMNPHFIFNAINSVQKFALNNDTQNLNIYLQQFSKLMRTTLDSSEKEFICLSEEISYLQQYIDFEKMKSDAHFEFSIDIDPNIDVENLLIPPMILQPILENSFKHAIPYTSDAKLTLSCLIEESPQLHLLIKISDNGPGLSHKKHSIYKPETHISKGILITQQRITELLQRENIDVVGYEILENTPNGVVNLIRLPYLEEF